MAAGALDLHEVAGAEVRYPSGVRAPQRAPTPSLHEPAQHFIQRARPTQPHAAVELEHVFASAIAAPNFADAAVCCRVSTGRVPLTVRTRPCGLWQLHLDALSAHLNGYAGAAALMLAIADAAEEIVWWRTQVSEAPERGL